MALQGRGRVVRRPIGFERDFKGKSPSDVGWESDFYMGWKRVFFLSERDSDLKGFDTKAHLSKWFPF